MASLKPNTFTLKNQVLFISKTNCHLDKSGSFIFVFGEDVRRATRILDDLEQDSRKFGTGKNQPFLAKLANIDRPLKHGGHVESPENKKLCFCKASVALNSRLAEACRAETKFFIPPRLNMAAE